MLILLFNPGLSEVLLFLHFLPWDVLGFLRLIFSATQVEFRKL
jgi:hypothetical protein